VHPNTVRAWSDRGVIPSLRINERGDRRYRQSDLNAFLGAASKPVRDGAGASVGGPDHPEVPNRRRATWAAQLQSIQLLGARLSRLTSMRDIGDAIASELHRLIDYHNVRVYRVDGDDLVPVGWQGQIGEYFEETEEQLRLKMGQGITGWVAQHGTPVYLPDAAHDPRIRVIPGTEPDLPESLLVVPTIYEERVIGVIVLSKLGLHQFTEDDLRLLVIYASFAAQAMANAATTEQLRDQSQALARQLRSQRELLALTESLLTNMDAHAILEQVGDSLGTLVPYDNLGIETFDPGTRTLRPIITRGSRADFYSTLSVPADMGVTGWVFRHAEPALVRDMLADPRVMRNDDLPAEAGSIIVAPLRGFSGVVGVIYMERLGADPRDAFDDDAFDLVKLFAAHASIALQNAEVYSAAEIRARTDGLTGLMNQTTFKEALEHAVKRGDGFSLIYLDLDEFGSHNKGPEKHQLGDEILRAIARALQRAGRETDQVYRYGGDEFTLLLPNTDADGAYAVARKVARAIRRAATNVGGAQSAVSASIGVSTFPRDGESVYAILLAADQASSVAKDRGGNRVVAAADAHGMARGAGLTVPTPVESEPEAGPAPTLRTEAAASIAG
jgi:diguanylate cyclase (GGDEF)-like protein